MSPDQGATCPICDAGTTAPILELEGIPVHCNLLHANRSAALDTPRGDLQLRFCAACGHTFNSAFDAAAMGYGETYDNALHHSALFRDYAADLADRLIANHNLNDARIVEIGCGDGNFLRLLCAKSQSRGIGFDPSHSTDGAESDVRIMAKPFDEATSADAFAGDAVLCAEMVVCRHALEHMADPRRMLNDIRRLLANSPRGVAYLEVPNFLHTLHGGVWDLIYEHCGYFSPASLEQLLTTQGFGIIHMEESYGGQFLAVEATARKENEERSASSSQAPTELRSLVEGFADRFQATLEEWRNRLAGLNQEQGRAVIWGAGSKGVMFLNLLGPGTAVHGAIDLNPRKQGMFVPGTGHPIAGPEALREIQPGLVIVVNPLYETEIRETLSAMRLNPKVMTL